MTQVDRFVVEKSVRVEAVYINIKANKLALLKEKAFVDAQSKEKEKRIRDISSFYPGIKKE